MICIVTAINLCPIRLPCAISGGTLLRVHDLHQALEALMIEFGTVEEENMEVKYLEKKRLFIATVESILLYGSDAWTLTKSLEKQLNSYCERCSMFTGKST